MVNTQNKGTLTSASRKKGKPMVKEHNVVDVHTDGKLSNYLTGDMVSDGDDYAVPVSKKQRLVLKFLTKGLENRYQEFNIGHRNILFGKSVLGDEYTQCGLIKLFDDLGMLPIINFPHACYSALVQEFYANIHVDKDEDYVSLVREQGICLTLLLSKPTAPATQSSPIAPVSSAIKSPPADKDAELAEKEANFEKDASLDTLFGD